MPIGNISSVLEHGILSHERASKLPHASVAMEAIQERRDKKQVPGGLKLHQYANLYFHARNPMLFKRKEQAQAGHICVLRISIGVSKLQGAVFTDCNASSDYVRFYHPDQWRYLPFDDIYALDWRNPDQITFFRNRSRKCAEVLIPHQVKAEFFVGAWVATTEASAKLGATGFPLPIEVNRDLFFC